MTAVTAAQVKVLRQRTGLGMMACKKALQESGGDQEMAIAHLRRSGGLSAASKSARPTGEGVVAARIDADGALGVLAEVNCETDFVAKGEGFLAFVARVLDAACAADADADALSAGPLQAEREALVQKVGENVRVRRVARLRAAQGGFVRSYIHGGGRIAALVAVTGRADAAEMARELAMHVAASDPWALDVERMPEAVVDAERAIYEEQARASGKPDGIVEKMVAGKLRKFTVQHSLLSQPFVKDAEVAVGDWLRRFGLEATGFLRYAVGEDLPAWRA